MSLSYNIAGSTEQPRDRLTYPHKLRDRRKRVVRRVESKANSCEKEMEIVGEDEDVERGEVKT
jgi:hypothetical protein